MYHLGGWEKLEQEAPRYALMVQQDIFKKILCAFFAFFLFHLLMTGRMQTNKLFLLDSTLEAGVMSNLDFVALEAIAANDF